MNDYPLEDESQERALTPKSLLFGLLGIGLISGLAGFHDAWVSGSPLMVGSHLPVGAYFFIMLLALVWNLIGSRLAPRWVLSSHELLVVMGMTLMACFPPTSGFFRYFQRQLVLPWYYLSSGGKTEWETFGILTDLLPARLFPQPAPSIQDGVLQLNDTVYRSFFTGLSQGDQKAGLADIPWAAWAGPLLYWGPLVVLMSMGSMGLSLMVHRQWAHHEQLSYPLAQVATSFISRRNGRGVPDVFRSRLFWWGLAPILIIYMVMYLHLWFPNQMPDLDEVMPNVKHWAIGLNVQWPLIKTAPAWGELQSQTVFFSVVGLAYFVSSEISLTMGLSNLVLVLAGILFYVTSGIPLSSDDVATSRAGAYLAYAVILLYTGRHYYGRVLRNALRPAPARDEAVMAARLTVLSGAGMMVMLMLMGLDGFIAILFTLTLMMLFLVFTRIICETGIPFLQPNWYPAPFLTALLGPAAIGPGPLIYLAYLGTILCQDPRECLMPYVATSIKMADDARVGMTRFFWILFAAVMIALVVGFVSTTWTLYSFGGMSVDTWAHRYVPTIYLDQAVRQISGMSETGILDESRTLTGLAKLTLYAPAPADMGYLLAGAAAVLVFSLLRFRFARFPLHPVLFLVIGTYPGITCWSSFLTGWAIKTLVVKFGGGKVYQDLKPLFIGVIAGELLAAGAAVCVNLIYFAITGKPSGIEFGILPG